jgi:hypothetical protein
MPISVEELFATDEKKRLPDFYSIKTNVNVNVCLLSAVGQCVRIISKNLTLY